MTRDSAHPLGWHEQKLHHTCQTAASRVQTQKVVMKTLSGLRSDGNALTSTSLQYPCQPGGGRHMERCYDPLSRGSSPWQLFARTPRGRPSQNVDVPLHIS
ncbi:hypothetical protein IscW_ISCW008020 [Ixodes scapularis]|uniref:Uncharacterized protein n=1 Tax=Ixodes scapularis TaxID=6945 RepID=B7PWD1_IXOSC|nr:hypothetical protein IscW_ISCW008020 [Ixodes scapularis]|eukprot:XP_002409682.1 hypothetical protein IscW_ISCW008020 [Ixodes scapularis]